MERAVQKNTEDSSSQSSREESLGVEDLSDLEALQPRESMVIMQRSRFQYKLFLCKMKKDPDEWLQDFIGISQVNGEDAIKLSILAGMLREEARPWY